MGFQGDLDTFGLATIFQTLTANQQSGTLHVFDDHSERFLVFSQGSIRSISTGERQNISLGEILVARNKISESDLATALSAQAKSHEPLGRLLVGSGLCSDADIQEALRFQMEEGIYDLFTWRGARFEFDEKRSGDTLVGPDIRISQVQVNVNGLILEAMRRIDEWGRLSEQVPTFDIVPVVPAEQQTDELFASLKPEEKRILAFVDGANNLDAITRRSCLGRYAVIQFMARLFSEGHAREATSDEMRQSAESVVLQAEFDTAVSLYSRILTLDAEDLHARQALASALVALERKKEAAREYSAVAEALCARQEFSEAADACAQADQLSPEDPAILERLASLYVLADRGKDAVGVWSRYARMLEEKGKPGRALEKVSEALQDLPDSDDLRRIQARLLLETGDTKGAVVSYELLANDMQSRGDVAGAIALLRQIVRLDGSRNDIQDRIRRLQMTATEKKHRRIGQSVGIACVVVLVLGGVFAGINEVRVQGQITRAIAEATALAEGVEEAEPHARLEKLNGAVLVLEAARPGFVFSAQAKDRFLAAVSRLRADRDEAERVVEALAADQARVIESWKALRASDTPEAEQAKQRFQALLSYKPETPAVREALDLYAKWQDQMQVREGSITELLNTIGSTALEPKERFAAFRKLAEKYPKSLGLQMPHGPRGLSLPAEIATRSDAGAALPARILIAGKPWPRRTPCIAEIPCDPQTPVILQRRGFGNAQGETVLKREASLEPTYAVTLHRVPRWTLKVKGEIEGAPVCDPRGRLVYIATTTGQILAVETESGSVRWPRAGAAALTPDAVYKVPLLLAGNRLVGLDLNGSILAVDPATGERSWPGSGQDSPLKNQTCLQAALTSLGSVKREGAADPVFDLLITTQSDSPVYAVRADTGDVLWPRSEVSRKLLQDKIGTPLGRPFHLSEKRQLLLVDASGRLHVLLEDGTHVGSVALIKGRVDGTPQFQLRKNGEVAVLIGEEGVGLYCFGVDPDRPLEARQQWMTAAYQAEAVSAQILMVEEHAFVGFASGRVVRLDLDGGACPPGWDLQGLPGAIVGGIVKSEQRLLITCAARETRPPGLVGLELLADRIGGQAWRYPLDSDARTVSGVTVFRPSAGSPGFIFLGAGSVLHCLDDEDP